MKPGENLLHGGVAADTHLIDIADSGTHLFQAAGHEKIDGFCGQVLKLIQVRILFVDSADAADHVFAEAPLGVDTGVGSQQRAGRQVAQIAGH